MKLALMLIIIATSTGCSNNDQVSGIHEFQIVKTEPVQNINGSYIDACVVSQANDAESRKSTLMAAIDKIHIKESADYYFAVMTNHETFCEYGSWWTAIGIYSVAKSGWFEPIIYHQNNQVFEWKILTSDLANSPEQIAYTLEYIKLKEQHKPQFMEQYGVIDYHEHLEAFVEKSIGKLNLIRSGAWIDDYFIK